MELLGRPEQLPETPYIPPSQSAMNAPRSAAVGMNSQGEITVPAPTNAPPGYDRLAPLHEVSIPGEAAGYFIVNHCVERPVTIRHYLHQGHDAIINNKHPEPALVERAVEVAAAGIPPSWACMVVSQWGEPRYVDSVSSPTLFTHQRIGASIAAYREHRENDRHNPSATTANSYKHVDQSTHSVLNEMAVAQDVRAVIGAEMHDIVQQAGYSRLEVIEPLMALVDNNTGARTLIYPHREGSTGMSLWGRFGHGQGFSTEAEEHNAKIFGIAITLANRLLACGIEPRLLNMDQIMLGYDEQREQQNSHQQRGRHRPPEVRLPLYLTGIGHYIRRRPNSANPERPQAV